MLTLIPLLLFLPQVAPGATFQPNQSPTEIAAAKRVFDANCASCHGPEGSGGKGPALAVPKLRQAQTDEALAQIIIYGIAGTEMPPSWYLGQEGIRLAAVYVRALGANATPRRVDGDAYKGRQLFLGKGACASCHTLGAAGHAYGPDLSEIGVHRSAASLRESIIDPAAEVDPAFVPVTAVTNQGVTVSGIRVNEDTFTIQIFEPSGRFHSFRKAALARLGEHPSESPMPSYKAVFSDTELRDLVAYLSSLRGAQ
jgi:cytochrome c oxidase cbb3-type subunit III